MRSRLLGLAAASALAAIVAGGSAALTEQARETALGRADYPAAFWHPANPRNYARSNRPLSHPISMIVIHVTDGSYAGAVNWFANPRSHVSAHYVVRSRDGEVTQTVREKNIAWHAGNHEVNLESVGIEHEAFESSCRWYTDAMYRSSAQLAAYLAAKYLIPIDRRHIIGHSEVPDPNNPHRFGGYSHHTDPGRCWNWRKYMALVRSYAEARFATTPQRIVDDARAATFAAPRGWKRLSSAAGYARSFALARPKRSGKPVRYTLRVPRTGSYALYSWWPAAAGRNPAVPVGIDTRSGRTWVSVDQRTGSGWRYLGNFDLVRGRRSLFVSRRTRTRGTIAADAFKVELVTRRFDSRLVSAGVGWAIGAAGLSRTADAGATWTTIMPPSVDVSAVRGADWSGETAYAVVATGQRDRPLVLQSTSDRGVTWRTVPLRVPPAVDVAAPVDVRVVDPQHVFVGARLEPNRRSLSRGLLLRTADGGATWVVSALPEGGDVSFPTATDGWLVGGFARETLHATHDGGRTWVRVRPRIAAQGLAAYDAPSFWSPVDGAVPVSIAAGSHSTLAFASTANAGHTWTPARALVLRKQLDVGETVPTSVTSEGWFADVRGQLVSFTNGGATRTTVGPLPEGSTDIQFTSALDGWARSGSCSAASCWVHLYATADGGRTWTRLHLPPANS